MLFLVKKSLTHHALNSVLRSLTYSVKTFVNSLKKIENKHLKMKFVISHVTITQPSANCGKRA